MRNGTDFNFCESPPCGTRGHVRIEHFIIEVSIVVVVHWPKALSPLHLRYSLLATCPHALQHHRCGNDAKDDEPDFPPAPRRRFRIALRSTAVALRSKTGLTRALKAFGGVYAISVSIAYSVL